ncbi:Protein of unknown function [Saccharopolyspora kobensis]|uniref:DUF3558 domain-containing protein n=1 Tax=Saccharopolyspora kobensis TaxID=146035 RepID=A0A1H6DX56_9PSEU|nr:DUF3558 family protein [Saccharopolyspora kobensis]SEG89930.1 Protein of unknown function [Saccharopolyspora kobensis]SFD88133.1 Protein of unknown function [Saccharopolyspora kobensis]
MRRWGLVTGVAMLAVVTGCTAEQSPPAAEPSTPSTSAEESATESAEPSITRNIPPERREHLAALTGEQICLLVEPADLESLAFAVLSGRPRELDFDPPVRGCRFDAESGARSVLIGAQREGFADLGRDEVELGARAGTRTLRAGDCTVYAGVAGATLQVSVTAAEADSDDCGTAERVAEYVLPALVGS